MRPQIWYCIIFSTLLLGSCQPEEETLFTTMGVDSGVDFENRLVYTEEFNPYTYRNFFNGGGVALGDVNNDGLVDIYFTGNLVDNKLYLNQGNWQFEDITASAGVACAGVWSTGATFADVNGDGLLDLYVCKSGKPEGDNRHNELFINNGDLTFTDQSRAYGLDIETLSTHAAFFDYDKDGDLDCYVLSNSIRSIGGNDLIESQREIPDPEGSGDKFFRNDGGRFTDVTIDHGIYTSNIGFGLGITLTDFNRDGWTDVFISNDFFERDYLYLNDRGQGFVESGEAYFGSISMGSMGADAADLDNDDEPDLFVTEMLPSTIERKRTKAVYESWDKYQLNVERGYSHQYPRNVLQRNLGGDMFVELGRFSGVAGTDWSWGALIFDADNDGLKDLFVANGIYKDLLDRDYLTYMANEEQVRQLIASGEEAITQLIDIMPSQAVPNAAYKNLGDFAFDNHAIVWGLAEPSFSNGSAYGDLDNDGDLDLIVNNVNMPAFVYQNNSDTSTHRSIALTLIGEGENRTGIGARVTAYHGDKRFISENYPSRGFQSSVDHRIHLGVGEITAVDSILVEWQRGGVSTLKGVVTNRLLVVKEAEATRKDPGISKAKPFLVASTVEVPFIHEENNFIDFDRDRLFPQMYHNEGPALAIAGDQGDPAYIFVGGAKGFPGVLYELDSQGNAKQLMSVDAFGDAISEDVDALFFDCDGDGDQDLYVASGGRAYSKSSSALDDRLYINDGKGAFAKDRERLQSLGRFSTGAVVSLDYDGDGDQDLVVTERFHPFFYGPKLRGYVLANDGSGFFEDVTEQVAPDFMEMPMVTDAAVGDVDGDGAPDVVLATEWGPVEVFLNRKGALVRSTETLGLAPQKGWWNVVKLVDLDQDGDLDIFAGNHGKNTFFKDETRLYIADFDANGTADYIFCEPRDGKYFPIADKNELIAQLPVLKKRLLYFKDYASMSMVDLFPEQQLNDALVLDATTLSSTLFVNEGNEFQPVVLPPEIQYGPVYAIETFDIDGDGFEDLLFGGNQYLVKPQFGRYDALPFTILKNDEGALGDIVQIPVFRQTRNIGRLTLGERDIVILANNNAKVDVYERGD